MASSRAAVSLRFSSMSSRSLPLHGTTQQKKGGSETRGRSHNTGCVRLVSAPLMHADFETCMFAVLCVPAFDPRALQHPPDSSTALPAALTASLACRGCG